jgi:hypothetical protein
LDDALRLLTTNPPHPDESGFPLPNPIREGIKGWVNDQQINLNFNFSYVSGYFTDTLTQGFLLFDYRMKLT